MKSTGLFVEQRVVFVRIRLEEWRQSPKRLGQAVWDKYIGSGQGARLEIVKGSKLDWVASAIGRYQTLLW